MNVKAYIPILLILAGKLSAGEDGAGSYTNFAVDDYSKETVEQESKAHYDAFGQHIVNGTNIYNLSSLMRGYSAGNESDSVFSVNNEYNNGLLYTNFKNLCIASDRIGSSKSAFMIGEQIHTQFTPLTMNKMHFSGLRWDAMTADGYALTSLFSRTRPGFMAKRGIGGNSYVVYPSGGIASDHNDDEIKNQLNWNNNAGSDWSIRTMFGDYDMFYGFHGEKQFSEKLTVGATFLNHHRNDARNGESWLGELPDAVAPEEIHFEFYDMTPYDMTDAGALLNSISMSVDGRKVAGGGIGGVYTIDAGNVVRTYTGNPAVDPVNGRHPLIVTFYPREYAADPDKVKKVSFDISVSGNYLVFVSTEKMTPLYNHWGKIDYNRNGQSVFGPVQLQVRDIVDRNIFMYYPGAPFLNPGEETPQSEVYFGDYIAKAPKTVNGYNNEYSFTYEYRMMLASMVGGLNLHGKIGANSYRSEIAYNAQRFAYPGAAGEVSYDNNFAGFMRIERSSLVPQGPLSKVSGRVEGYFIDAGYSPNLPHFQVSRSFSVMNNSQFTKNSGMTFIDPRNGSEASYFPHYLDYPIAFCNYWSAIDDNEDDDLYVEGQPRPYPAELQSSGAENFFGDGAIRSNDPRDGWPTAVAGRLRLPTGFDIPYDDVDGVIAERYDRNRDGEFDYRQDFLLYESDPPMLGLDVDRNNNNVFDAEEDNLYPDYPYETGNVYTTNGFRSLGVRGLRSVFSAVPLPELSLELGGIYERVQDVTLDGETDPLDGLGYGRNASLYCFARYLRQDREKGITYFAGEELKKVNDGIRNDVVVGRRNEDNLMVYRLVPDILQMRNAFVSNTALGVEYQGIPNLQLVSRMFYGAEKHFEADSLSITRALSDTIFAYERSAYEDKLINSFIFIAKGAYKIAPKPNFTGMLSFLNIAERLQLTPQYKFMYEMYDAGEDDPRLKDTQLAFWDSTGTADSLVFNIASWDAYNENNSALIMSVPLLRMVFELGAKTYLEGGIQWKRMIYPGVEEDNHYKRSTVLQLRNQATYQGYSISLILGASFTKTTYDINSYHKYYRYGSATDDEHKELFFRIYAGIN